MSTENKKKSASIKRVQPIKKSIEELEVEIEQETQLSPFPDLQTPQREIKTLLKWSAPGRPFRERSMDYFINSFLIMAFVEVILFLFSMYMLMLVVFALVFLAFALAIVPPHHLNYRISTEGIQVEDYFYLWDELYDFYFMKHHGQQILHVSTKALFPGELIITLGDIPVDDVKKVLLNYLPFREYVKPALIERWGDWLEKNFPLEKSTS